MKYFLILLFSLIIDIVNSQCYIQYTYNSSGNRVSRVYVGCSRPIQSDIESVIKIDSSLMGSNEIRTELIHPSMDAMIKIYPNPSAGYLTVEADHFDPTWTYKLTAITGQVLSKGKLKDRQMVIDINHLLPATYGFAIYYEQGQMIYYTQIIKL